MPSDRLRSFSLTENLMWRNSMLIWTKSDVDMVKNNILLLFLFFILFFVLARIAKHPKKRMKKILVRSLLPPFDRPLRPPHPTGSTRWEAWSNRTRKLRRSLGFCIGYFFYFFYFFLFLEICGTKASERDQKRWPTPVTMGRRVTT